MSFIPMIIGNGGGGGSSNFELVGAYGSYKKNTTASDDGLYWETYRDSEYFSTLTNYEIVVQKDCVLTTILNRVETASNSAVTGYFYITINGTEVIRTLPSSGFVCRNYADLTLYQGDVIKGYVASDNTHFIGTIIEFYKKSDSPTVPTGISVYPTDNIRTLLACANINNPSITTISALLADTTALSEVISSTNAIDYLARSTTFATDVCNDNTAMLLIGANNYASNQLLANNTWATAIANSTQSSSVLNVGIPTMTSDTTPSGVCSATAQISSSYEAWFAFDKNLETKTSSSTYTTGGGLYVQYEFPTAFHAYKAYLAISQSASSRYNHVVKIQGSNDGIEWTDLTGNKTISVTNTPPTEVFYPINGDYKYFRVYKVSSSGQIRFCINEFNVYGRQDV